MSMIQISDLMISKARLVKVLSLALLATFSSLSPVSAQSQTTTEHSEARWQESGLPFIQNFDPKDYQATTQNSGVTQDHRGVMYFANTTGVLEYDGVFWRLITIPNSAAVLTLATGKNGIVYVGAEVEFGYLAPDSLGQLRYLSLLDRLPPEKRDFFGVRQILPTRHGVYFSSDKFLFRLENIETTTAPDSLSNTPGNQFRIWETETTFQSAFAVGETIYVQQANIGLMKLGGGSLRLAQSGQQFENEIIKLMLQFPASERSSHDTQRTGLDKSNPSMLIGTDTDGLFLYDGVNFQSFKTEADIYLREKQLYSGINLADGTIALATTRGGVVIIDQQGRIRQIINKTAGLRNEHIRGIYRAPTDGALWLALDNGLARVNTPAPLTIYAEELGITSSVLSIVRHRGKLYASTHHGLYYLSLPSRRSALPTFKSVADVTEHSRALLAIDETLLAATIAGVYQVEGIRGKKICDLHARYLYQSPRNPKQVYVGLSDGLALLQKINGNWQLTGRFPGTAGNVVSIFEDRNGVVWAGTRVRGLMRVEMQKSKFPLTEKDLMVPIENYGSEHELPAGEIFIFSNKEQLVFGTQKGLRRFDQARQIFVPDFTFGKHVADTTRYLHKLVEDGQGRVWIPNGSDYTFEYETGAAVPQEDGSFLWQEMPALELANNFGMWAIYAESDSVVWFGSDHNILRYDPGIAKNYTLDFSALVRRVLVNGDSLIYGGAPYFSSFPKDSEKTVSLAYEKNSMRFEYAGPNYDDPARNQYQVFLEGFDDGWAAWTSETKKDYTNLPGGDYRFRIRAKNIYDHLSSEGVYEFTISPPWYRTIWAYAFYAILVGLFLYTIRHYEAERMQRKHQRELLGVEHKKLQEVDRLKSQFFANITHEFRTPLTLIMGQVESELAKPNEKKDTGKLQMALRNAQHLLRLINQLLDLSKIEAGRTTLNTSRENIIPLLKKLTSSFESLAEQKRIDLRFECEQDSVIVDFEKEEIEKIMYNLLSNGMKFTKAGGKLNVRVSIEGADGKVLDTTSAESYLLLTVKDAGIGIPKDRLPYIFDRFYQVDSTYTREHEGTGIGLALTKELVELHGGTIAVESTEGFGTTFTVRLPIVSEDAKIDVKETSDKSEKHYVSSKSELENQTPILGKKDSTTRLSDSYAESYTTNNEIILVVEDNADVREYVRQNLSERYHVIEAKNGEDGFAKAQEVVPDLIISDVMMPKIDGYEMAVKIRDDELTSHIPIIMLTAKAAEDEKIQGLETGVDAYLTKPFSTRELQLRVRKLIELRQKLRKQRKEPLQITSSEVAVTSVDEQFLERIQLIVEENMADENFQVEELCRKIGIGERQLYRKLHALLDCTPASYIRLVRLDRAKQLLEKGGGTVSEITFQVGYTNTSAFARAFREVYGQAPSEFLKNHK